MKGEVRSKHSPREKHFGFSMPLKLYDTIRQRYLDNDGIIGEDITHDPTKMIRWIVGVARLPAHTVETRKTTFPRRVIAAGAPF